jgi:hypothetical protein
LRGDLSRTRAGCDLAVVQRDCHDWFLVGAQSDSGSHLAESRTARRTRL